MRRSAIVVAEALALLVVVVGCGEDEAADLGPIPSTTSTTIAPVGDRRSTASSPFTVDPPPVGFVARSAGRGRLQQVWGEDCCGSDQPYLVLSPDGTPDHPDVVLVSITGYQGYQGQLAQASIGYGTTVAAEVDGEEAYYVPADTDAHNGTHWADLVVAQGDADLAVRVTSPQATEEELAAFVEHVVVPDDHTEAPSMPDPPDGYAVLGSVDATAALVGQVFVDPHADAGPGPADAHSVGWLHGGTEEGDPLAVMTLPGQSADLDALAVGLRWRSQRRRGETIGRVDDRTLTYERVDVPIDDGEVERSVWRANPAGDLVVVLTRGADPVAVDVLVDLATSVAPTDQATWDAFVAEVRGG